MKSRSGQKLKLTTVEELLGVPNEESAAELDINLIHSFKNHPFKVLDDDKMVELTESIRINGVLSPVLVRSDENNGYEMISGHRRLHAAMLAGLSMIPAIVKELTDEESIIYMVDSNIQREELLPSEKAFAYKMKMDAMKRKVGRPSKINSTQFGWNLETAELVGQETGESKNQIRRYIRLTELIPELLDLVDKKQLQFTVAVDISYIDQDVQKWIFEYIHENGCIRQNQVTALRNRLERGGITQGQLIDIFNENMVGRFPKKKVILTEKKLSQFFPPHYSTADMEQVIEKLLRNWSERQEGERDEV